MRIILVSPPPLVPLYPHAALGYLAGYLRDHGHEVSLVDASAHAFSWFCAPRNMAANIDRVLGLEVLDAFPWRPRVSLEKEKAIAELCRTRLRLDSEEAYQAMMATLRGPSFYDFQSFMAANNTVRLALHLASTGHGRSLLSLTEFHCEYSYDSVDDILAAVADRSTSLFYDFYREEVLPRIEAEKPGLVGLSFSVPYQLIPGFILGAMIKEALPGLPVVIGGSTITRLAEDFQRFPELAVAFDHVVTGDGELPLTAMADALDAGVAADALCDVLAREGGGGGQCTGCPVDMKSMPPPFFADLYDRVGYLTPEPVAPILATRGCYWSKCSFCDIGYGYGVRHRRSTAAKVFEDMCALYERHGVRVFKFVDECLPPNLLRDLSRLIIESGIPFLWEGCLRYERFLREPGMMDQLAHAGCRSVFFGLESGSQRVLDLMNKGHRIEDAIVIQDLAAEAGIVNNVFMIAGYPGESEEDHELSRRFLIDNAHSIHSVMVSPFRFARHSPIGQSPEECGLVGNTLHKRGDSSLVYEYDTEEANSLPLRRAQELWEVVAEHMPQSFGVFRELYGPTKLLYAGEYATNDFSVLTSHSAVFSGKQGFDFTTFGSRL